MDELRERVRQTILTFQLVRPGDRVLVGVSGGPDSVCLLRLLVSLRAELRVSFLSVVHVDHGLRPESREDTAFVEELTRRLELPVTVIQRDALAESKTQRLSLEDAARRVRYHAFHQVAKHQSANRLALAHTADDQAETVMMRMVRGAGLAGLSAIPMSRALGPARPRTLCFAKRSGGGASREVTVIRPLLGVWRREILTYLKTQGADFRQDASNQDPRFLRNRVRAQLLPLLERDYNPNIKALLAQLAEQCRTDVAFLQDAAERKWRRLVKFQNGGLAIRIDAFLKQPKALQRQLVRLAIQHLQGDVSRFEFRHWVEIERLFIERPVGTRLDLPGELQLERERERVLVRLSATAQATDLA